MRNFKTRQRGSHAQFLANASGYSIASRLSYTEFIDKKCLPARLQTGAANWIVSSRIIHAVIFNVLERTSSTAPSWATAG